VNLDRFEELAAEEKALVISITNELEKREENSTVFGLVSPDKGHLRSIQKNQGVWVETDKPVDIYIPAKLERVLTTKARQIFIFGGRGSAKSITAGDICLADAHDYNAKTFCLREFQSSISDSVHALLVSEIERLEIPGFETTQNTISKGETQVFSFKGISRNPSSVKSAFGFKTWLIEEAQFCSEESLETLMPSARKKPNKGLPQVLEEEGPGNEGVRLIFVANLGSMEDPFTKRIAPYLGEVEKHGYYEDDLRLVIKMNYSDNPWFMDSGMERERLEDKQNMPAALYDHIWEGATNDSIEDALLLAEWFDACIDAHKTLGFEARGAVIGSHDPSDLGNDSKGYCTRHGSVITRIEEKIDGNVNDGGHWAADWALKDSCDYFTWDIIGMGAGLVEQFSKDFEGKKVEITAFNSSESPDDPNAPYKPALEEYVRGQLQNKDVFKNKRAQYAFEFRDRVYRTYLAVTQPQTYGYQDPDTLISFSSTMPLLRKFRAEACRIPRKSNRNGLNELYTKDEMKSRFKLSSPNLFDTVMMSLRYKPPIKARTAARPPTIKPMRSGR